MRITIQVTCESPEDAMDAMRRLTKSSPVPYVSKDFIPSTEADLDRFLKKGPITVVKDRDSEGAAPAHKTLGELEREDNSGFVNPGCENKNSSATGTPPQGVAAVQPDRQAARPNNSPGEPSITKIGADAKTTIMTHLQAGLQPDHRKYTEHMKLLWKRGEIKFDDRAGHMEYYL